MATPSQEARGEITKAWWAWNAFSAGAVGMLSAAVINTAGQDPASGGALWLIPGAAVAFVLVPAVLVLKHGVLAASWQRKPADAQSYRRGLTLIWASLELAVVLCSVAAMASDALLPSGILAGLCTMAILALRPSADAVAAR